MSIFKLQLNAMMTMETLRTKQSVQVTTKGTDEDGNIEDRRESVQATTKGTNDDGNVTDKIEKRKSNQVDA